jgi:protease I
MRDSQTLAGKRIAVLVESQYIPAEIEIYQRRFAGYGATVELMSRLWGQPRLRFYSTVEPEDGSVPALQWLEVAVDVSAVEPAEYAAVIMAANYTSVRLRYSEEAVTAATAGSVVTHPPAVRFFRRAMEDPRIIKGAPCHALWLLTPWPNLLAGRKVICNPVVLADVVNAGAIYTPCPPGTPEEQQVVADGDIVTSTTWRATEALVDEITDAIVALGRPPSAHVAPGTLLVDAAAADEAARQTAARMASMTFVPDRLPPAVVPTAEVSQVMADGHYDFDRLERDVRSKMGMPAIVRAAPGSEVLFVAADHGVWASELTLPMRVCQAAGYTVRVATLSGRAPMFLPASLDEHFEDPTWGAGWVAPGEAELGWQVQQELFNLEKQGGIVRLDGLIPARPQARDGVERKAAYEKELADGLLQLAHQRAVVVAGGTGAIIDLADNSQLEAIIQLMHHAGRPVVTVCYGTLALLYAEDGALMKGVTHTIHNRADDFVTGTAGLTDTGVAALRAHVEAGDRRGFVGDGSVWTTIMRSPTTKAEVVGEAIGGAGAQVISPYTPDSCAVIDTTKAAQGRGPIITGRSVHCGYDAAVAMVAHQFGSEPLAAPVLMMTGGQPARAPAPEDYNANRNVWS